MDASVAVSLEVVVKFARFEDLKITFVNVLFSKCLDPPASMWTDESVQRYEQASEKPNWFEFFHCERKYLNGFTVKI